MPTKTQINLYHRVDQHEGSKEPRHVCEYFNATNINFENGLLVFITETGEQIGTNLPFKIIVTKP